MADASIYSMIRPAAPPPDPIQQYGQVMNLKTMMGQQGLQDLQRTQLEKGIADEAATEQAYAEAKGDRVKLRELLTRQGRYKQLQAMDKSDLDTEEKRATIDSKNAEILVKATAAHRDALANVNDPQSAAQWVAAGYQDPVLGPSVSRLSGPLEVALSRIPQDPAQFAQWKQQNALGATKFIEQNKPHISTQDLGGTSRIVSTPGLGGAPTVLSAEQKTATPGELLSRQSAVEGHGVTMRGQNLTNARALEAAARDAFTAPQEVTGADGRPRLVMQNKKTGEMVDVNTREPATGIGPKPGEAAQKQLTGVAATKDAIQEYRDKLKTLSPLAAANPGERARMGTIYNNMLLQAKEAYNLGVLNGPDYQILQEVITNPLSWTGTITSKKALDDQAKKLDDILTKVGSRVTQTQSGVTPPTAPAAAPRARNPQTGAEVEWNGTAWVSVKG